jgi:flagellar biogenesis protein FliO
MGTDGGVETWSLARAVYAVLAVAAVLVGLRFALARLGAVRVRFGRPRLIELIETVALPYDAAIAVVRVGRDRHVVAVGRGTVVALGSPSSDEAVPRG